MSDTMITVSGRGRSPPRDWEKQGRIEAIEIRARKERCP
jgi:hypothetical protein